MDIWIVVAAASAVYLSKQWQKILRHRENSSESFCGTSDFEKPNPASTWWLPDKKSCPLRSLAWRKKLDEDISIEKENISKGEVSEMTQLDGTPAAEVASACGADGENLVSLGNHKDCNVLFISSLANGFSRNDNLQENEDGIRMTGDIDSSGDFVHEPSTVNVGPFLGLLRKGRALRTKRLHARFARPISSLESCLMAQLYNEHAEMEEYVLSSLQSPPAPTVRPLFTSDGSRIINKASGDSPSMWIGTGDDNLHKEAYLEGKETAIGVPSLPKLRSMEQPRKMKLKTGRGQRQRFGSSSKMINRKHFHSQGGSPDGMVLFCLGISIGMIFSQISNKREVDEMKELLQRTENLVQDLQEELEMKDSLTVKELANEDYESQYTHDHAFGSEANEDYESQDAHEHACHNGPSNRFSSEPCDQKAEENSELMSKIEAELEAELERLELSMNSSCLERKLSNLVELDPDIVADVAQGELKVEMVGRQTGGQDDSYQDVSSTSTTHSANYAVSPRELSLRLHEVIQSRLEERVKELETELQNSNRKLQFMESERLTCYEEFADSILGSSTQRTPIALPVEESNPIAQLSVVNLPEDAYNEVEDFMKETQSESEDFPSTAYRNNHQDGLHQFDGSVLWDHEDLLKVNQSEEEDQESSHQVDGIAEWGQNGRVGDSMGYRPTINKERQRRTFIPQEVRTLEEHILMDRELSGDENNDEADDEMKLLIQQIVEKSRQGSPIVLNVQRALFSVDENEH